jgi:hypothetical protein
MPCLFGDATRSELEPTYLQFVRDFIAFAVDVLLAAERIDELSAAVSLSEDAAETERRKLTQLQDRLTDALRTGERDVGGIAERCTEAIERACEGVIADEIIRLERELSLERATAERSGATQRKACEQALERLLLGAHRLPESGSELDLDLVGGTGYAATLRIRTTFGLEAELDLEIAEGNLFATPVRAAQVAPGLELHLPENRGWISKKMKLVKHKLGKHEVTALRVGASRVTVSLRQPDAGDGYDIVIDSDWPRPRVIAVTAGSEPSLADAHPLELCDEEAVQDLLTTLVDNAEAVRGEPVELTRALLDGQPLASHDDPTVLVDRIIELIAPTVREIGSHSLDGEELVLKRELGADRREEIYLPKQELLDKIEALSDANQARFDALGLRSARPPAVPPRPKARGTAPPPPPGIGDREQPRVVIGPPPPPKPARAESQG